ncbi:MAG: ATP synthase F1 subunit delta [Saprospiraceae bacterium]|jgi:F-type H+-transporting ATPase subunit delta|nr:ATP synthase F1 subunit delta [Saprospiraceae bacterium]MBP9210195.1 ATP synthase F1 subunit delta [Saprospiraceae bacterium]MBV6472514.1 ATP synthase subunit delta [Saprospiraceae bacterium]
MSALQIAGRYAKSLIDLSTEQQVLAAVAEDMSALGEVCRHPEFLALLQSPIVPSDKKTAVVQQLFGGKFQKLTISFALLLVTKGREGLLPSICTAFAEQYRAIRKVRLARVITAVPLDPAELKAIETKFSVWLAPGETMELEQRQDPSIIGGFIFEMGDRNYNASIRRQLGELKENLHDTSYVSLIEKR